MSHFKNFFSAALLTLFFLSSACVHAQSDYLEYGLGEGVVVDEIVEEIVPEWTGSFGAGLNGKSGNSTSTDINMTLNLARETDLTNTTLLGSYFYTSNDVATITDRAFGKFRQERKLANPKVSWYYQSEFEWDRFKDFDYRIALHTGLAYQLYKFDDRSLKLRLGGGASREVGGAVDEWLPELQFGGDWERKLSNTTKLYATVDYYPNVEDFSDYRVNTNTGLDFLLDAHRNINFRLFALNRYDSTPAAGNDESDIDYGMSIVIGF